MIELETERLVLRGWTKEDLLPFFQLNSDPVVMEYFPNLLTEPESNSLANDLQARISENGWGFWALELKENRRFLGFVGLNSPKLDLPFTPCIEIGWRLSKQYWGKGYAGEAAAASMGFAFSTLNSTEVVSFTSRLNVRSASVMTRLGMKNTDNNFFHPKVPADSPLFEHVLYSITAQQWAERCKVSSET